MFLTIMDADREKVESKREIFGSYRIEGTEGTFNVNRFISKFKDAAHDLRPFHVVQCQHAKRISYWLLSCEYSRPTMTTDYMNNCHVHAERDM